MTAVSSAVIWETKKIKSVMQGVKKKKNSMAIKHMKMRYDYRHTKRRPYRFLMRCGFSMGILQARILEWVAVPSSRGSSRPRDRTPVSMSPALAGGLFTTSATREALVGVKCYYLCFQNDSCSPLVGLGILFQVCIDK